MKVFWRSYAERLVRDSNTEDQKVPSLTILLSICGYSRMRFLRTHNSRLVELILASPKLN